MVGIALPEVDGEVSDDRLVDVGYVRDPAHVQPDDVPGEVTTVRGESVLREAALHRQVVQVSSDRAVDAQARTSAGATYRRPEASATAA